ncbi:MAG: hypothetical protein ACJ74E_03435, partial [Actinomycetes bacterium]
SVNPRCAAASRSRTLPEDPRGGTDEPEDELDDDRDRVAGDDVVVAMVSVLLVFGGLFSVDSVPVAGQLCQS